MKLIALLASSMLLFAIPPSYGHGLHHEVARDSAVVLTLFHGDRTPFSNETYEIFPPSEDNPFQVGRTDALGRIIFVPDRTGPWRIKAHSEDGHGLDITLDIGDSPAFPDAQLSLFDRHARLIAGIGVLFGLFGLINLFYKRRNS